MSKQVKLLQAFIITACMPLLINACTTSPKVMHTSPVHYQCERGTQLSVVFHHIYVSVVRGGRNGMHRVEKRITGALVTLADGHQVELPAQKNASGFLVSNGRYTFSGKGDEVIWAVGRMAAEKCTAVP